MMRLGSAEFILTRISDTDRQLIKDLALSRGCLTIKEFARVHELCPSGARKKVKKHPYDQIFKSVRLIGGSKAPEFFLLRSRYGRLYAITYREPQSLKTILDALLRFQIQAEGGVWQHNLRHAGVMILNDCAHISDCLDRSESAILNFASEFIASKKIIHTLSPLRLATFQVLLNRSERIEQAPPQKENAVTWDDVWNTKSPSTDKKTETIEIRIHDLSILSNLQV
jgi:hypothetical protein